MILLEKDSAVNQHYDWGWVEENMRHSGYQVATRSLNHELGLYNNHYYCKQDRIFCAEYETTVRKTYMFQGNEASSHIELSFMLDSDPMCIRMNGLDSVYLPMQQNMQYIGADTEVEVVYEKGKSFHNFDFYVELSFLERYAAYHPLLDRFISLVARQKTCSLFPRPLPISAATMMLIQEIRTCSYTGVARQLFIESKLTELISLQLHQFDGSNNPQGFVKKGYHLSAYDIDSIHDVAAHIRENAAQFNSITELAQKFGMNEHKLKNGFKDIFSNTLFGYAQEIRMAHAKMLLLNAAYPIKDIAYSCGYQNPSAFANAFKRHYGCLPYMLRK